MLKKVCPFVFVCFLICQSSIAQKAIPPSNVKWYSLNEAFEMAKKEPRPILLDVYTDWCSWCKYMMRTTFANKGIADYINTYFYAARLNAETTDTIVFQGKKYFNRQIGRRPTHDLTSMLLDGQLTYPSIVFFDRQEKKMVVSGYKEAKDIEPFLVYFAENLNSSISINDFFVNFMFTFPKEFEKDHSIFNVENSLRPDTLGKINWVAPENILKLNKKRKKPVLLYFYTDWCISCKVMEHTSFGNRELAEKINSYYHTVKINATEQKQINFLGKTYSGLGVNQPNELARQFLIKNYSMPALVVLDENYNRVTSINGYLLKKHLIPLTDYFYNKVYKKLSLQEFLKNYVSSVSVKSEQ